jgi:hypothetical protein
MKEAKPTPRDHREAVAESIEQIERALRIAKKRRGDISANEVSVLQLAASALQEIGEGQPR